MLSIMKKELKNYFCTPIGYVIIAIFLIAFSAFFYLTAIKQPSIDLTYIFYNTALYGLMFMIPLLTMWSIAGERKNGTDQLIMTAPVSMTKLVLAKFFAATLIVIIPILFSVMYFVILAHYHTPDVPTYILSAFGFFLLSTTYISFGILSSSLTDSPIISAIITFAIIFIAMWLPLLIGKDEISLVYVFINFLEAQLDWISLVLFASLTVLCLLLTIIVMQRRKSVK